MTNVFVVRPDKWHTTKGMFVVQIIVERPLPRVGAKIHDKAIVVCCLVFCRE
jgi:hypothetical protein